MNNRKKNIFFKYKLYNYNHEVVFINTSDDYVYDFNFKKTKIKCTGLPKTFLEIELFSNIWYINTANVVDVKYNPCNNILMIDQSFDLLYISYTEQLNIIEDINGSRCTNFDCLLYGNKMIEFLTLVEQNSNIDVSKILMEIKKKRS